MNYFGRRREARRRAQGVVGLVWVWDRPMEMTRAFAEYAERHVLPMGWSVLRDNRPVAPEKETRA